MKQDVVNIIIGDSIAYGYGDNELFGWCNRLRFKNPKIRNHLYFNLSIPGQSSVEITKRFKNEFLSRYNKNDVFNVLFAFGIKDALKYSKDNNHITVFENNVKQLISFTKKYSNNIVFLGLLDVDVNVQKNYNVNDIHLIDKTLNIICKNNNVKYIKMSGVVPLENLIDGIHPNEEGYQKMCDYLIDKLVN